MGIRHSSHRTLVLERRVPESLEHFWFSLLSQVVFYHDWAVFLLSSYTKPFVGWQTHSPLSPFMRSEGPSSQAGGSLSGAASPPSTQRSAKCRTRGLGGCVAPSPLTSAPRVSAVCGTQCSAQTMPQRTSRAPPPPAMAELV